MTYPVILSSAAERELLKLAPDVLRRIDTKLTALSIDPRPKGALKLEGKEGQGWRIRVGDYRVLYVIDDDSRTVRVYKIGPRSDVYRR